MDIDAYLKRLKEASSDSERVENETNIEEEDVSILSKLQIVIKFGRDTLCMSKLITNVRKVRYKRHVNINTMEYDFGSLWIESNAYMNDQGIKNITKLA